MNQNTPSTSENINDNTKPVLEFIAIKCIIFRFFNASLQVLVERINDDKWRLPTEKLFQNEDLDDGAKRIASGILDVQDVYLKQFQSYRDFINSHSVNKDNSNILYNEEGVSVGYYMLTNKNQNLNEHHKKYTWMDFKSSIDSTSDNAISDASRQIKIDLNDTPIALHLLAKEFTIPEMMKLYEIILGRTLNRGNFYRKIKDYNILIDLEKKEIKESHNAAILYSFDRPAYFSKIKSGFVKAW